MENKNVVVIGGGTGLSLLLRGLKYVDDINISAIVTVADNGGSTGKLREEHNLPAMGDIRRVIAALSRERPLLEEMMEYRFGEGPSTGNHSLGNLMLTAMANLKGSFTEGVNAVSKILNIRGAVIPSSNDDITLVAKYVDGKIISGEHSIPEYDSKVDEIFYNGEPTTNPVAISAIESADFIIFSMGSLYTSIIANIALPGIKSALVENKDAKKVYIANVMTQPGETDEMSINDHVIAINKHVGIKDYVDIVIETDTKQLPSDLVKKYAESNQMIIVDDTAQGNYKTIRVDILDDKEKELIRHSDYKITNEAKKLFK